MSENSKKTRKYFENNFKRSVLVEYARGKKPSEIFSDFGIDLTDDKKYSAKLVNKWKSELYKNMNIVALNYRNISPKYAPKEINYIGKDEETDDILEELLTKKQKRLT